MKVQRILLISVFVAVWMSIAYTVYNMIWSAKGVDIEGKNLLQLLRSDVLPAVLALLISLVATWLLMRSFLRHYFPTPIRDAVTVKADVLKVWDTGTTLNDDPEVGMLLKFDLADGTPFQAETKTLVSRLQVALVRPGVTAEIKYDPRKPKRLQIVHLYIPDVAQPGSSAARMEELNALRDKELITEEEYQRKRGEILNEL